MARDVSTRTTDDPVQGPRTLWPSALPSAAARFPGDGGGWSWQVLFPSAALAAVLALSIPLFLASPVWVDTLFYDMCARNLLDGGVHYRDIFDTNLPGMVWAHVAIRLLLGWSSEAIRLVDLIAVSAIVALLISWLRPLGLTPGRRIWLAAALFGWYFSLYEWCHCQRDVWMLLPALIAVHLRRRQLLRATDSPSPGPHLLLPFVEGICWGVAFWIKPMIVVPAIACEGVALFIAFTTQRGGLRRAVRDLGGLLAGAGVIGGAGAFYLWESGTWVHLLDVMCNWNPEYMAQVWDWSTRFCVFRMGLNTNFPWPLVHLVSLPTSLWAIWRCRISKRAPEEPLSLRVTWLLLVALYYGWLMQAIFLQLSHEYVQVPITLLALAVAAPVIDIRIKGFPPLRLAAVVFFGLVAIWHPLLHWDRLSLWPQAVAGSNRLELKDQLALPTSHWGARGRVDWQALKRVEGFLRGYDIADGEVTCFHDSTFPLYLEMNIAPSTRYLFYYFPMEFFRSHREEVRREITDSRQRFVVADLMAVNMQPSDWAGEDEGEVASVPSAFPDRWRGTFPWYEPVVFRAGRYQVHRVTQPAKEFWGK